MAVSCGVAEWRVGVVGGVGGVVWIADSAKGSGLLGFGRETVVFFFLLLMRNGEDGMGWDGFLERDGTGRHRWNLIRFDAAGAAAAGMVLPPSEFEEYRCHGINQVLTCSFSFFVPFCQRFTGSHSSFFWPTTR
jgi:hypothetical protein